MTYYESAAGQTMSYRRVLNELKRHGQGEPDLAEFLKKFGVRENYDAQEVLDWLGY